MSFCPETPSENPKISKIGSPVILGAHNFVCKPPIEMISRANLYLSLRAFQQYVAHHLNVRKSGRFLIFNGHLTPNLSFGHNLCFKCQYGSCKTILDIYVPRAFQWYKKLFNPMGFNPLQLLSKNLGVHGDSNSQSWSSFLRVWGFIPSHSLTFPKTWDVIPGLPSWPAPL